ncbi:hypothetical protein SAMN04488136_1276 [Vibrio xiamenensis]|uniref:Uncharacterized protein n=1 Tax=Vibrio xiamenensis TaxID=861298 RepID=A0A1G8EW33_9VIBR|nr:hypothetical protein SAMN04488136_1276 [Vibrio xiamenensis]
MVSRVGVNSVNCAWCISGIVGVSIKRLVTIFHLFVMLITNKLPFLLI